MVRDGASREEQPGVAPEMGMKVSHLVAGLRNIGYIIHTDINLPQGHMPDIPGSHRTPENSHKKS